MTNFLKTFVADESGASAAEYALILIVVGIAIVAGATALATSIGGAMCKTSNTITAGAASTSTACPTTP